MLLLLAAAAIAAADTSKPRPPNPAIAVERLGNTFTPLGSEEDQGLAAQKYRNNTLERDELWHLAADGRWFLRARPGVYVLGVYDGEHVEWKTDPSVRLVLQGGAWKAITLR